MLKGVLNNHRQACVLNKLNELNTEDSSEGAFNASVINSCSKTAERQIDLDRIDVQKMEEEGLIKSIILPCSVLT